MDKRLEILLTSLRKDQNVLVVTNDRKDREDISAFVEKLTTLHLWDETTARTVGSFDYHQAALVVPIHACSGYRFFADIIVFVGKYALGSPEVAQMKQRPGHDGKPIIIFLEQPF